MSADAKIVSGYEHPSGLRDAVQAAIVEWEEGLDVVRNNETLDEVLVRHVVAWLSVVSEGALERLVSALERTEANFVRAVNGKPVLDMTETLAENRAAFAASRRVLVPRIESDENGGTK